MSTIASMTGYSRAQGHAGGIAWVWELRSVNSRGLDIRFRLPAGCDALEPRLREAAVKVLKRGSVNANLVVKSDKEVHVVVDPVALEQVLALVMDLHRRIPGSPPPRAETLLGIPGVLRVSQADDPVDTEPAMTGFLDALGALVAARREEGARLSQTIAGMLAEIAALHREAVAEAANQPIALRARVMENLATLLREGPSLPEERIAQEVALLAARSDSREELDRLASHIQAAHALLREGTSIGRRFDFLVQEFNREANTLCSKSASTRLTAIGLQLKAAIEQLREQVQNIE